MNNQDKKFLVALIFAQTGLLAALIMFSPLYWLKQAEKWEETKELAKYSQFLKNENHKTGIGS